MSSLLLSVIIDLHTVVTPEAIGIAAAAPVVPVPPAEVSAAAAGSRGRRPDRCR
jgi:hypothetical protein